MALRIKNRFLMDTKHVTRFDKEIHCRAFSRICFLPNKIVDSTKRKSIKTFNRYANSADSLEVFRNSLSFTVSKNGS